MIKTVWDFDNPNTQSIIILHTSKVQSFLKLQTVKKEQRMAKTRLIM